MTYVWAEYAPVVGSNQWQHMELLGLAWQEFITFGSVRLRKLSLMRFRLACFQE